MNESTIKEDLLLGLDVGCGQRKAVVQGYQMMSIDIRGEVSPDIIGSFDKIPVPDCTFDLIFSSHTLEHVKRANVGNVLKEWRRVLVDGGKLQIIVPDLEIAAIELLSCQTNSFTFDILWGMQEHEFSFHYSGYTWMILEALLKKYGFEINFLQCQNREIHCTATKLKGEYL